MKKAICLLLALVMALSLCACGKSKAVKAAQDAIGEIGQVTMDSGEAIKNAEKLYSILTEAEKAKVNNRLDLVEARETYDSIVSKAVYENAYQAYEKLMEAADLCIDGMDDIYNAWYYGIYEVDRHKHAPAAGLAGELNFSFSVKDMEAACKDLGIQESALLSDWQYSLRVVIRAHATRGTYDTLDSLMGEANDILQELTATYGDYEYYPKLKEYYAKVSSYVDFFRSPSGSFNQLADTINDYENNIRTYQADVGFLFTK